MKGRRIRRFIVVGAVLALLVAGLVTTSVATEMPCAMTMVCGVSCPDCPVRPLGDTQQGPATTICFVKCPAPALDRAPAHTAAPVFEQEFPPPPCQGALVGIGVAPPLEPPRI